MVREITHEEKVEEARARVKTAYDLYIGSGLDDPRHQTYKEKWAQRKEELKALITPKKQYNE